MPIYFEDRMKNYSSEIPGVYYTARDTYLDKRGTFSVIWDGQPFTRFCMADSFYKVIRGLHYHTCHANDRIVRVSGGKIFDVLLDMRLDSPTFGKYVAQSFVSGALFYVPRGVAHGYQVLSKHGVRVEYWFSDGYYPECEKTVLWNDPYLSIPWPLQDPIVSDKDAEGKLFVNSEYYE